MKKQYLSPAGLKKVLQSLRAKLDNKFRREADRVDEMIAEDRLNIENLQEGKADKATTLEGYGITDALPSSTPYAKSSSVGGSASSFETSIEKSNKDLPVYFASPSATEVTGIAAHNNDLSFNPATGALKANEFVGTVSGVASEAEQFDTPAAVELRGAVVGKAESQKDWTIETTIPEKSITEDKITDNTLSNSKLKNSSIKLGKDSVQLGGELNSLDGLQSVTAAEFTGTFKGTADRAIADGNGNVINTTYITKQEHQDHKRRIEEIEGKVPAQASPENQLADKSYVVDQINSVSAYYLTATPDGEAFASKAALIAAIASGEFYFAGQLRVPTKNDYCLINKDETHENMAARYVYQGNNLWAFQYVISQISFTTAQQKAIDSGVTREYLTTIEDRIAQNARDLEGKQPVGEYLTPESVIPSSKITEDDTRRFVTDSEKASWDSKAEGIHSHTISDVRELPTVLSGKAEKVHDHAISDIDGLSDDLDDAKVSVSKKADITYVDRELSKKANTTYVDNKLTEKADESELADLRIDVDGVAHENAGEAVRTQINQVKSDLGNLRFSITENNLLHIERKE